MKMELPHLTSITSNVAFRTTDDQCPSEDLSYLNRAVTQPKLQPLGGSIRQSKRNFQGEECESTLEPQRKQLCRAVSRRIPCKARGVSQEHRADIAFFDVPEDAPHGLLLRCSSDECANSPRRFRYCRGKQRRVSLCIWSCAAKNQDSHLLMTSHLNFNTVCAIPVSRRNFVNRHGHGLVHSAKDVKTRVDQNSRNFIFSQTMTCSPCGVSAVQESRNRFASSPHKTCHSDLHPLSLNLDEVKHLEFVESQLDEVPRNCRRVPCRARCMPKEHNAATAYFEIPNDAFHGMALSCSMEKCRGQSGGPRFRYCKGKLFSAIPSKNTPGILRYLLISFSLWAPCCET